MKQKLFFCKIWLSIKAKGPVSYYTSAIYLVTEEGDRVFDSHYTVGVLGLKEVSDGSLASEGEAEGLGGEGSGLCVWERLSCGTCVVV